MPSIVGINHILRIFRYNDCLELMEGKGAFSDSAAYPDSFGRFIGISSSMCEIYSFIERVAATDKAVLIVGDPGTGKKTCAEAIHYYSNRCDYPFISADEASLDGIEQSLSKVKNGTLFIKLKTNIAVDFFSSLENFSCRIICSTSELNHNSFFEQNIIMPRLCERGEDVVDIATFYLNLFSEKQGKTIKEFSSSAKEILLQHDWPNNVREVQNLVANIVTNENKPVVTMAMLPEHIKQAVFHKLSKKQTGFNHISLPLWQIEKRVIEQAIELCGGNIPQAAKMLEISPSTIYRKIQSWDEQ